LIYSYLRKGLIVLPTETSVLLNYIDNTICVFFFLEFCIRFFQAENKLRFMRWGWVDLISSIPAVSYLRAGRVFAADPLAAADRGFPVNRHMLLYGADLDITCCK
jgi:voltage-gated potassium channel